LIVEAGGPWPGGIEICLRSLKKIKERGYRDESPGPLKLSLNKIKLH